jgi:GAF domain-containing protein
MSVPSRRLIWLIVGTGALLQVGAALLVQAGALGHGTGLAVQLAIVWILIVSLGIAATRRMSLMASRIEEHQHEHRITLGQMEQLEAQNAVLQVITRTPDVALAFQTLARRITRVVRCDRLGLALLSESGQQLQTYTARAGESERRNRPRPELEFSLDRSLIGQAVREREPLVVDDLSAAAADYFDANVLHSAGFKSALLVPLISKGRSVGTITLVNRTEAAFRLDDAEAILPIAEILAVAHVAQQAQMALARYRTVEAMSDLTLSIANDINGALQIIVGHCDLLERSYPDPALQRDLATIIRQARRISELLEKMRVASTERLRETAASVDPAEIPTSPETLTTQKEQI